MKVSELLKAAETLGGSGHGGAMGQTSALNAISAQGPVGGYGQAAGEGQAATATGRGAAMNATPQMPTQMSGPAGHGGAASMLEQIMGATPSSDGGLPMPKVAMLKAAASLGAFGIRTGMGKGKGMPGGGRRNKMTEPCPDDGPGEGAGEGKGKGKNRKKTLPRAFGMQTGIGKGKGMPGGGRRNKMTAPCPDDGPGEGKGGGRGEGKNREKDACNYLLKAAAIDRWGASIGPSMPSTPVATGAAVAEPAALSKPPVVKPAAVAKPAALSKPPVVKPAQPATAPGAASQAQPSIASRLLQGANQLRSTAGAGLRQGVDNLRGAASSFATNPLATAGRVVSNTAAGVRAGSRATGAGIRSALGASMPSTPGAMGAAVAKPPGAAIDRWGARMSSMPSTPGAMGAAVAKAAGAAIDSRVGGAAPHATAAARGVAAPAAPTAPATPTPPTTPTPPVAAAAPAAPAVKPEPKPYESDPQYQHLKRLEKTYGGGGGNLIRAQEVQRRLKQYDSDTGPPSAGDMARRTPQDKADAASARGDTSMQAFHEAQAGGERAMNKYMTGQRAGGQEAYDITHPAPTTASRGPMPNVSSIGVDNVSPGRGGIRDARGSGQTSDPITDQIVKGNVPKAYQAKPGSGERLGNRGMANFRNRPQYAPQHTPSAAAAAQFGEHKSVDPYMRMKQLHEQKGVFESLDQAGKDDWDSQIRSGTDPLDLKKPPRRMALDWSRNFAPEELVKG